MSSGWSSDFTYDYYRRLLDTVMARFQPILLKDAPEGIPSAEPQAVVRHDVDVSPLRALAMAEIEAEASFQSTYLFLIDTPLYRLEDQGCRSVLREMIAMGHDVGLHYELHAVLRERAVSLREVEEQIQQDADRLAQITGQAVRAVSFHRPIATFLRGQMRIGGLVNAYAKELMEWYISDSNGNWREGEPIPQIEARRHNLIQILVHPIWWGPEHLAAGERLAAFFDEQSVGRPDTECEHLDRALVEGVRLPGWAGALARAVGLSAETKTETSNRTSEGK
jgi:hypothetical protein